MIDRVFYTLPFEDLAGFGNLPGLNFYALPASPSPA